MVDIDSKTIYKTKGFVLTKVGEPETAFELQEITLNISSSQILVEVSAFGLNYADVMARKGKYREAPPLPSTIGYEVVGNVVKVGSEISSDLIGKRVLAFTRFGGYARHAITEDKAFILLDDEISDEDALSLCTQYVTAYYMTNYQSSIHPEDIVLIHAAAGGVGTGLIQLCKNAGATIIAKVGQDTKIERVKALGADFVVNYHKENYEQAISSFLGARKLSYSFNAVGGSTFKKDVRLLGAGGKVVLFGGAELTNTKWGILSQLNFIKKMGQIIPIFWMMQAKSLLGVNMLKIAETQPIIIQNCLENLLKLYKNEKLKTYVDKVYDSSELATAHHYLESGKSMGKIVVKWNEN